ncbi:hypothetical protein NVP1215B_049 [Vibrio phage 1.215.B._10N.222.54.F7]|nr:hypothetical protein NVP1215A_049 [Vibrio phage 1.215.A._10N.222.54.F7]AUR96072.1 hypothetical protein NVP1215B_049 [Vibrio phage 1.215.B._10N.222.54.F7]
MNALSIAQNNDFVAIALQDALELIAENTGISVSALIKQFPTNVELQTRCAEMVATAAKVTAESLNA